MGGVGGDAGWAKRRWSWEAKLEPLGGGGGGGKTPADLGAAQRGQGKSRVGVQGAGIPGAGRGLGIGRRSPGRRVRHLFWGALGVQRQGVGNGWQKPPLLAQRVARSSPGLRLGFPAHLAPSLRAEESGTAAQGQPRRVPVEAERGAAAAAQRRPGPLALAPGPS